MVTGSAARTRCSDQNPNNKNNNKETSRCQETSVEDLVFIDNVTNKVKSVAAIRPTEAQLSAVQQKKTTETLNVRPASETTTG